MRIGVVGLGDTGLPFALLCKESGYSVYVSDKNENLILNLNQGIYLGDEQLVQKMLFEQEGISATTESIDVILNSDIIFTFENTTQSIDGNIDTSPLFEITNMFFTLSQLEKPIHDKKFVICTTTNYGDTDQIQDKLSVFNIQVAYNPKFIENDEIVKNLKNSELILIGTNHTQISDEIIQIYRKIQSKSVNAFVMSAKSAELTKLSISSFTLLKNTYANMIGNLMITLKIDGDINNVLNTIGFNSRLGNKELKYGFGGTSLTKDNKSLISLIDNSNIKINLPSKLEDYNELHLEFIKEFWVKKNPDKSVPFVIKNINNLKENSMMESSQQFKLCVDLLSDGYTLHIVKNSYFFSKLKSVSELYDERLKFFKEGTTPEGCVINF